MPIDDVTWTNCRNCGHRYADYVRRCPRCGTATKSNAGKAAALGGLGAAIVAVFLLWNANFIALPDFISQLQDGLDNGTPLQGSDTDSPQDDAGKIEYVIETTTEQVLSGGAFLGPNDVRTFSFRIPNHEVTTLEGTIVVDGSRYLHMEFADASGGTYCHDKSQCSFDVYGEGSGKSTKERNNKVSLPVNGGDSLKLIITNPESESLQTASINLYVSYQAMRERIVPAAVEEEPGPEIVPVVEEAPDEQGEPEVLQPASSGVGRDVDPEELASRVHELINQQRKAHGLASLDWDAKLAIVAERHSRDMADRDYFAHDTPEGKDPTDRAEAAGYNCRKDYGSYYTVGIAENLFQHWTYDSITYINGLAIHEWNTLESLAQDVVEGWMDSPGHRQNILTEGYDREGIGVTIASNDKVYVTENFC